MKKYNYNFSVITPGGCSAACSFCTDSFSDPFSKRYIEQLATAIKSLPSTFSQVSVTGGEPTQSPMFGKILDLLYQNRRGRFDKTVLTTNGWKLLDFLPKVAETFDHVNISRHAIGDQLNFEIFKTNKIAKDEDIKLCCTRLAMSGVDVNLNRVYTEDTPLSLTEIKAFIVYAKNLNATKVTFRLDQNTNQMALSYTERQVASLYRDVSNGGCPVCREATYLIDGMYVTFKNSCAEPTKELKGELYELVFHPDGRLYKDWSKQLPYIGEKPVVWNAPYLPSYRPSRGGSGGCGSTGSGGCGS